MWAGALCGWAEKGLRASRWLDGKMFAGISLAGWKKVFNICLAGLKDKFLLLGPKPFFFWARRGFFVPEAQVFAEVAAFSIKKTPAADILSESVRSVRTTPVSREKTWASESVFRFSAQVRMGLGLERYFCGFGPRVGRAGESVRCATDVGAGQCVVQHLLHRKSRFGS